MQDASGRVHLARSKASIRVGQRNYRRHILGRARGNDYRVLNVTGDVRLRGYNVGKTNLPPSLIKTGGRSHSNYGAWMWDRPTRRDIRENKIYGKVNDRDRSVLKEMADSVRKS